MWQREVLEQKWLEPKWLRKLNPPPVMNEKSLKRRIYLVQKAQQKDTSDVEAGAFHDPRDKEYQWSIEYTRKHLHELEMQRKKTIEQYRESLGIPKPPYTMMDDALAQIRKGFTSVEASSSLGAAPKGETKKGKKEEIDLSALRSDFASMKGISLAKVKKSQKTPTQQQKGRKR